MKAILLQGFLLVFTGTIGLLSCRREISCEGCVGNNKPPIAAAGPDVIITLPTDSVLLDGSKSSDPDGTISTWQWTKISGPASFHITHMDSAKTFVKNLVAGTYQFVLTVTDDKGASASDTVQAIVQDPALPNHPPVACAGTDQTITLPASSATLDGSCSTDSDQNITGYAWAKISGPSSGNITNATLAQTSVSNLVAGTYQFELTVTDAGNLSSKDIVVVNVLAMAIIRCDADTVHVISGAGTLTTFAKLSEGRVVQPATAANKLVFAGGVIYDTQNSIATDKIDIYDLTTKTWSTTKLKVPRSGWGSVTVGNKILFTASEWMGNTSPVNIEIYDAAANTWSAVVLDSKFYFPSAVSAGNKAFFAGGLTTGNTGGLAIINIYDAPSNTWSVDRLSQERIEVAATTTGDHVFFGGGYQHINMWDTPYDYTSRVDIYNIATNKWSMAELSEARSGMAAIAINNKVIFAGGYTSTASSQDVTPVNTVDVYDLTTNTWTTTALSEARYGIQAVVVKNKAIFAGGYKGFGSNAVDIYDATTNSWSTAKLSQARVVSSTAVLGNKVLFFTGGDSDAFDIYDVSTNTWSSGRLDKKYGSFAITAGNEIFIGEGNISSSLNSDKFTQTCLVYTFHF
jgi:hypothetical protein